MACSIEPSISPDGAVRQLDRRDAHRAVKVASISQEAKAGWKAPEAAGPPDHHPRKSEVVVPVPLLGMEKQEGAETPQPSPIPQRPLTVRAAVAPAS